MSVLSSRRMPQTVGTRSGFGRTPCSGLPVATRWTFAFGDMAFVILFVA